jgi:hypothetical protein
LKNKIIKSLLLIGGVIFLGTGIVYTPHSYGIIGGDSMDFITHYTSAIASFTLALTYLVLFVILIIPDLRCKK